MKRFLLALTIGGALLFGCSQTQLDHALNNLSAYQCDNQQATLANFPTFLLTESQLAGIVAAYCATTFGTAPAPTPAPGNSPVFSATPIGH
jgi:hypothetical protein